MIEGWSQVEIGDICKVKGGKRLPKGHELIKAKTPHPYIRARDIRNGKINFDQPVYITEETHQSISRYVVGTGDVIITIVGANIGDAAYVTEEFNGANLTENAVKLVAQDKVEPSFLKYSLTPEYMKYYFQTVASGAAQDKLGLYKIKKVKINLPPLSAQRKIAAILSAYDDLIENNLKRIKLLEEKAQLTYEEWFSVKGVPEGWIQIVLGEVLDFHIGGGWGAEEESSEFCDPAFVIRGTDIDKLPYGSINNVPSRWHKESNLKSRKLRHGDIVFEVSGGSSNEGVAKSLLITESLLHLFHSDVMCASFCKLMRPKSIEHSYALVLFLKYLRKSKTTEIYEKRSASNIVNYNWEAFLKFQQIKLPEGKLLEDFNSIVEPLLTSVYNLTNQIIKLKEARDILLPRLMTGMINVEDLDLSAFEEGKAEEMLMAAERDMEYNKD